MIMAYDGFLYELNGNVAKTWPWYLTHQDIYFVPIERLSITPGKDTSNVKAFFLNGIQVEFECQNGDPDLRANAAEFLAVKIINALGKTIEGWDNARSDIERRANVELRQLLRRIGDSDIGSDNEDED